MKSKKHIIEKQRPLAEQVKEFCTTYGLTHRWFAERFGMHEKVFSYFLHGSRALEKDTVDSITAFIVKYRRKMAWLDECKK